MMKMMTDEGEVQEIVRSKILQVLMAMMRSMDFLL